MNDTGFLALADSAISYVDETWGRLAAWALALSVTVLPIGVIGFWLLR